ncbi:MAG: hypothetical protein QOF00_6308, partial [Pseudonocardiales bacterium]|nr:hypothetical protein [Pseudonocardiales bacterium]
MINYRLPSRTPCSAAFFHDGDVDTVTSCLPGRG